MKLCQTVIGAQVRQQEREPGISTSTNTGFVSLVPDSSAALDVSLNLFEPHLQTRTDNISYRRGLN